MTDTPAYVPTPEIPAADAPVEKPETAPPPAEPQRARPVLVPVTTDDLSECARKIMAETPFFSRLAPNDKTRAILLDVITTMPLPGPIATQLTRARDERPPLFQHLVRTSLISAGLTLGPLVPRFDIQMAAAAGMLHDLGMLHVDPLLSQPEQALNPELRRQQYSHPLISTGLIESHHQYPKEVVRAVREHHECLDGSGYPRNLVGEAISPLGKTLSLAKVVSAMFAPGLAAPELRISVLLRMNTHRYDNDRSIKILALLRPDTAEALAGMALQPEPVKILLEINATLKAWPSALITNASCTSARRDEVKRLGGHIAQIHRAMANVGADPEQLALLGDETLDEALQREMTLLTREATWQLRTLARQTRRRWNAEPGENFPPTLESWLERVDAAVAPVQGNAAVSALAEKNGE